MNNIENAKAEVRFDVENASAGEIENCPDCHREHVPADAGNDEVCKVCDQRSGVA